jgi:hypothetical protein
LTRIPPPKPREGEDLGTYWRRVGPWEAMTDAATEVKNVRSRAATALRKIERLQNVHEHWRNEVIPDDQRARVEQWRKTLADIVATLDVIDLDDWKPEVIAAIDGQERP